MNVGVPKEVKPDEYRVALTPAAARELTSAGHTVLVQQGAGDGSSFSDEAYAAAGAIIVPDADSVFDNATLVLKVKEPVEDEYLRLRPNHVLCAFLHLAPYPALTQGLLESGATCLAYETVETRPGELPLLAPMSEVAGRIAVQAGAHFLERTNGGEGKLLGGVTGVAPARVLVLGAGIAGMNAALIASGMRAHVTVTDVRRDRLQELERFVPGVTGLMSNQLTVEEEVMRSDLVIGAVLVPGAKAPMLVSDDLVKEMKRGSVVVDLSIDQGGCIATSRMTTHSQPTYTKHGVLHYCVGNVPGAVPITSTVALTNAILPYVMEIADKGIARAAREDAALAKGINVMEGKVTNPHVARATGNKYFPLESLLPIDYM